MNISFNKHTLQIILLYILWSFIVILSLFFAIRIMIWYLFISPTDWSKKTNNILPNLGNLYIPAFGMYLHFWAGCFVLILGLIVILPISRKYIIVHRILGNMYVISCVLTSIGGNIFIYTTGTVGGINMDISFSIYGWLLFFCAIITYVQARRKIINSHKAWAIRLWALGLSSLFYRVSYTVLGICGYSLNSTKDFMRPLDMILDWWFFVVPLIIAEIYIRFLMPEKEKPKVIYQELEDTIFLN